MLLYYSYFVRRLRQHYRKYFKVEKSNKFSDKYLYPLYLHRVPLKTKDNIFEHKLIDEWLNKDKDVMFLIEKINKEKDESKIIDLNDKLLSALIELNRIIKEYSGILGRLVDPTFGLELTPCSPATLEGAQGNKMIAPIVKIKASIA